MFDIVVCHGPKDSCVLDKNIQYNKQNVLGYNNFYVITHDATLQRDDCIVIHESCFPFNIETIKAQQISSNNRYGWYLQQLIKLYAPFVIEQLLDNYLVIDCDTLFLSPTTFIENDILLYNCGTEHHVPYFDHMKRMSQELSKQVNVSGICHHMMFNKHHLLKLFSMIESEYNTKHDIKLVFYEIFLRCIDSQQFNKSGASEYEIYFNYMLKFNPDKIKQRRLRWGNGICSLNNITEDICLKYDYGSFHWYMRRR